MGLSSKFGKYPKFPTAGHYINPNRRSIHLTKFPLPCPGTSAVVLGDNALHPPLEVLSLLLSSHQRRFWISRSEIGYEKVLSDLCSGNKRRSKLQTIEMSIIGRPLSKFKKPGICHTGQETNNCSRGQAISVLAGRGCGETHSCSHQQYRLSCCYPDCDWSSLLGLVDTRGSGKRTTRCTVTRYHELVFTGTRSGEVRRSLDMLLSGKKT